MKAWHFTNGNRLRDGRPLPKRGEWLVHEGRVEICRFGLHASEKLLDALEYAPGSLLHRVECDDVVDRHDDKFVCRRRRILWSVETDDVLRVFAGECAGLALWATGTTDQVYLDAVDATSAFHRGEIARDELYAAWPAARDAAWAVAWPAARAAARAAAWDAAWAAAWAAARDAAWAAAWAAVRDAAWAAAWDPAWDPAWAAAWAAARDAEEQRLVGLVTQMAGEQA